MKKIGSLILCLCVCLALGVSATDVWAKGPHKIQAVAVVAHSGYIMGKVVTCDPDEGVPGALVHLPGWSFMAKTDAEGMFRLFYVPKGVYEVLIEVPDHPPLVIEDVEVRKMEFTDLGPVAFCPTCSENADCPEDAFCAKEPGDCEGEGVCEPRPEACPDVWDPVCGCDGITYGNPCEAAAAGVNIAHPGECAIACMDNEPCPDDAYCAKAPGDCDGEGVCEPKPLECPLLFDPVCGCDGATYDNMCFAAGAGVNIESEGECPVAQ